MVVFSPCGEIFTIHTSKLLRDILQQWPLFSLGIIFRSVFLSDNVYYYCLISGYMSRAIRTQNLVIARPRFSSIYYEHSGYYNHNKKISLAFLFILIVNIRCCDVFFTINHFLKRNSMVLLFSCDRKFTDILQQCPLIITRNHL